MQRKIALFVTSLILMLTAAEAQFKKGMRMEGTAIGSSFFNSGKTDYSYPAPTTGYTSNNTALGIAINPMMGWFVSDNTVVGALLNLAFYHQKTFDEASGTTFNKNTSNIFNIGIGGFARNYFKSSGNMIPFGQFNLNFGIGSSNNSGFKYVTSTSPIYKDTYDGKSSGDFYANTGLAIGATKMLNSHTGLDFFAGYTFSYAKSTFKTTTLRDLDNNGTIDQTLISEPTQKFTNHGFTLGVGFQIFLDKKN